MLKETELTQQEYEQITQTVYKFCGIKLGKEKQNLVKSRLSKRLTALRLTGYDQYIELFRKDRKEFSIMIDSLTTNKTDFFREMPHFNFMSNEILPVLTDGRRKTLRIWSAACSSGEEPYSIAMLLQEIIPDVGRWDIKILATDISNRILEKARKGEYDEGSLDGVNNNFRQKYFTRQSSGVYQIKENVKRMIRFAHLNLMDNWRMQGPFDIIFCRNVMIYFDKQTQGKLVNRFYDLSASGGYLFVGHSESLNGIEHKYRYLRPAIYLK